MKLRKRIAAVAAAMVMATSMMMTSASAATGTGSGKGVELTGYTNKGSVYGYASAFGYNTTATTRYMYVSSQIYTINNSNTKPKYQYANATANGGFISSGQATEGVTNCSYAIFNAVLYNSPNTIQGGQYGTAFVSVVF